MVEVGRRTVLAGAWATPVVLLAATAPGAAASETHAVSWTWVPAAASGAAEASSTLRITNDSAADVEVTLSVARLQGDTELMSWNMLGPAFLLSDLSNSDFVATGTLAAGGQYGVSLGFTGPDGEARSFAASLTSPGDAQSPAVTLTFP
ncbi:hypothetical protein N1031_07935 [Herbiconiux moechotypicola]|uniref:Uncharacterized protein n=1 Tax=Herbiconiux moechotypicola TaxID=637393 RepID=A0ABN3DHW7_9MICO|nr:hypothetical protein [Herbiconiux moechotypicola]MCS5729689.1 hypothetical protein [Herbiconiux moechotypicola]